jgi:iron(III) transport system permease protein
MVSWLRGHTGWILLALVLLLLVGLPTVQLIGKAAGGDSFQQMWDLPGFGTILWRTFVLGAVSSVLAVVVGVAAAWSVNGLSGRLRTMATAIPAVTLLVPAPVLVIGWIFLLSPRVGYLNQFLRDLPWWSSLSSGPVNVYSTPWIVIITAVLLMPFTFAFIYSAMSTLGSDYEAAASVSGASSLRAFFTITVPLLRPSIAYAFGIALVLGAGQFSAPLLLGSQANIQVVTTEIYSVTQQFPVQYGLGAALSTPLVVLGLVLVVLQRRAVGDGQRFITGRDISRMSGRRTSRWRLLPVSCYGLLVLVPLLAVVQVAFSRYWSGRLDFSQYTDANLVAVIHDPRVWQALETSVLASLVGIVILVPLTYFAALALLPGSRAGRVLRTIVDFTVNIPLGIPATVFGFGVLFAYSNPPFDLYGTVAIIVIVYVTIMLPFATRLQLAALLSLGSDYREASVVSGAGPIRTLLRVTMPLTKAGIISSAVLTFVLMMHEFSASLIVRSTQTQVLGGLFEDMFSAGTYPQLAVLSLLLVALTAAGAGVGFGIARILSTRSKESR